MREPIGFVGLGSMGGPMALRLLRDGPVIVYDQRAEAVRALEDSGAEPAEAARVVADGAGIVGLCLPSLDAARAVLFGAEGIVSGSRARVVVDFSTTGAEFANEMAAQLARYGIKFVSAPVSGGAAKARNGTLAVIIAGDPEAVETVMPYLGSISANVFNLGSVAGSAQTMKLLNNILSTTAFAATCEVMIAGVKAGLDPDLMIGVLNACTGRNSATIRKFPDAVLPRTFDYGSKTRITAKDADLCLREAEALGVPLTIGRTARELWQFALENGAAELDSTHLVIFLEKKHGVEVRGSAAVSG